jgi:hypothetical protein
MAIQNLTQSITDKEMNWEYLIKTEKQLKNWFSNKKSSKPNEIAFKDFKDFKGWYDIENIEEEHLSEITFADLPN